MSNTASAPVGCPTGNRSPNVTGAPHGYKKVGDLDGFGLGLEKLR